MKITVTQGDIDNGLRAAGASCPIALAVQRTTGRLAHVGRYSLDICDWARPWSNLESWMLPVSAHVFVDCFDQGDPVEPFEFELTDRANLAVGEQP